MNPLRLARNMWTNAGTARELLHYLWEQKLWWMVPMVVVLLAFGLLLIFASASGVGPFIYSLF